jgi:high affinity sulfate transporter 1
MTVVGSVDLRIMTAARPSDLVHPVAVPPQKSFLNEIRSVVRETFFHDVATRDGWFQGGNSRLQQGLSALKAAFPIVDWLSTYSRKTFLHDLLAGFTIASLAIPQLS